MKSYRITSFKLIKDDVRRHSTKHIVKLYNKLQNGEILDYTYSNANGDGSLSTEATYYMNDRLILIRRQGYYANGDVLFIYSIRW